MTQLTNQEADSVISIVEYLYEDEQNDFVENTHESHIFLRLLEMSVKLYGTEPHHVFTVLANDGDHYDEMKEAWETFSSRKLDN
jgi:hypothetical protein